MAAFWYGTVRASTVLTLCVYCKYIYSWFCYSTNEIHWTHFLIQCFRLIFIVYIFDVSIRQFSFPTGLMSIPCVSWPKLFCSCFLLLVLTSLQQFGRKGLLHAVPSQQWMLKCICCLSSDALMCRNLIKLSEAEVTLFTFFGEPGS